MKKKKLEAVLRYIFRALPNICIVLACMFVTFLIINHYNRSMNFINNSISLGILWALSICAILVSVMAMILQRALWREKCGTDEEADKAQKENKKNLKDFCENGKASLMMKCPMLYRLFGKKGNNASDETEENTETEVSEEKTGK